MCLVFVRMKTFWSVEQGIFKGNTKSDGNNKSSLFAVLDSNMRKESHLHLEIFRICNPFRCQKHVTQVTPELLYSFNDAYILILLGILFGNVNGLSSIWKVLWDEKHYIYRLYFQCIVYAWKLNFR